MLTCILIAVCTKIILVNSGGFKLFRVVYLGVEVVEVVELET